MIVGRGQTEDPSSLALERPSQSRQEWIPAVRTVVSGTFKK